jgi:hypothetical protein
MSPRGNAVPEPVSGDSDAVVTALESAEIFRARGDLNEAARWLRRGAELASDDGSDQRALLFAQAAVELTAVPAPEANAQPEPEAPRAPVDDIMAELFDQPLAPALKPKARDAAPAVVVPAIPPPAALPSIPEPPPLIDAVPPAPPQHIQAAFARTEAMPARAEIAPPSFESVRVPGPEAAPPAPAAVEAPVPAAAEAVTAAVTPPLPSPARAPSEPARDATPSSLPDGPPLRPSGMVSVTQNPPERPAATKPPSIEAAPPLEFDDSTPATLPQLERSHQATKRTAVWAGQELLAQSMTEEPTEPGQTWEDQTQADSTSAAWAVASNVKPKSEPPPKPKPRAPTLSKLDIEWESPRAQDALAPPSLAAETKRAEPVVNQVAAPLSTRPRANTADATPVSLAKSARPSQPPSASPPRPAAAPRPSAAPLATATLPAGSMATEAAAARAAAAREAAARQAAIREAAAREAAIREAAAREAAIREAAAREAAAREAAAREAAIREAAAREAATREAAMRAAAATKSAPRVRAVSPVRRALRGTLQATTEDGVFVFVPLSAQERPQLHTHEALIVLVNPSANLEQP